MFDDDDDSAGVVQGDFAMNGLIMFVMMLLLILPFISDPARKTADAVEPPGQGVLRVELFWPDGMDTDVDLWVRGPDGVAVGYSNLGGPIWNLLRDDLGAHLDISGRNMEIAYSRGIFDGDYVVNAHLYALKGGALPVPVTAVVSYAPSRDAPSRQLFYTRQDLVAVGQELTLVRFAVRDLAPDLSSLSRLQTRIRSPGDAARP